MSQWGWSRNGTVGTIESDMLMRCPANFHGASGCTQGLEGREAGRGAGTNSAACMNSPRTDHTWRGKGLRRLVGVFQRRGGCRDQSQGKGNRTRE